MSILTNIICGILKKKQVFYFNFDKNSNILTMQPKKMQSHVGFSNFDFDEYPFLKGFVDLEGATNNHNYIKFINLKFISIGRGCFQAWVPAYIEGSDNGLYPISKLSN